MARLSETTETSDQTSAPDSVREQVVDALRADLGELVVDVHLVPHDDVWVRVAPAAWLDAARALRDHGFQYFCFLSAIDWMPSPYGKGEDDPDAPPDDEATGEIRQGCTGGDTRFQVFARVVDIGRHVGITLKTDVPESMAVPSWIPVFAGANWHERECNEMFGIGFDGHPDLRNLYLPGEFEGFPLRKDFPLLARMIKPWPGIVDVEPMPDPDPDPDPERVRTEPAPAVPPSRERDGGGA